MGARKCEHCTKPIPKKRLKVIPDTKMCVKCSEIHGPKPAKGYMVGADICVVDSKDEEAVRRAERANRREY